MNAPRFVILVLVAAVLFLTGGCAGSGSITTAAGPDMAVPVFDADDPQVQTAGFVRKTLRLTEEHDGVTYTLMAFVVDDTMTLGAMVKGGFSGDVEWRVADRSAALPFDTDASLSDVPVMVHDDQGDSTLVGQGASFRGTSWVNIEVDVDAWGADGTPIQLIFTPRTGSAVHLPDASHHYVLRRVPAASE